MKQGVRKKLSPLIFILLLSTATFFVGTYGGDTRAFGKINVIPYNVTFVESGLASGTSWSVTFNGAPQASTSASISFTVPNGVYAYSVSVPSGYTSSSPLSGTVTVEDADVIKNIAFTPIQSPSYTLTMLVVGEGTVSPSNGTHLSDAIVSLEALASDGWDFSEWSGDASGTTNTTIVMDGDKVVTATFTNVTLPEFQSPILLLVILIAVSATVMLFGSKQLNVSSGNLQKR